MVAKTENLLFTGLFISIFIAIVMGFVIGSLVENLVFKDIDHHVQGLVEEELKSAEDMDLGVFVDTYSKLNTIDPLIIGLNIIDLEGTILYSDESSLVGKKFSDEAKIRKVFKNNKYFVIDRNLISQETILKETQRHLLVLYYYFDDSNFIIQILYDIRSAEKSVLRINSLLWFTILLSVGVLFIVLLSISNLTRRTLEKAKKDLEIEVKNRIKDLQELSSHLDKQVKERTKDLEFANKEIIKKTINLTETTGQLDDKNYELKSVIKNLNEQNKDLIEKAMALTELQAQLDDKNFELEKANKEILDLMSARTQFINRAAHDLRTPITPILVLIPIIKKYIKDKEILNHIKVVERNANYLKRIADDLISFLGSQSTRYNYIFRKIDIKRLIEAVLETYEETFKQHEIIIREEIPGNLPSIELDELKITEVIQNIVSNALKFVRKEGKLEISVKKMDNFINIKFIDTGIGMIKETLSKVFVEFYKADESRHIIGAGLGLSICKEIIENHHGKIWVESEGLGKGSTISFNIPIKQNKVNPNEK